ncbi:MAG: SpoIIE family protein phosphatase [Planctomycetota bacterium]
MATLTIVQGGEVGKQFRLDKGEAVIGRSPDCDVVLDVAAISRRHAVLLCDGGAYYVRDNGSRNGTFVNGMKVADPSPLRDGDQLLICDVLLEFHDVTPGGALGGSVPTGSTLLKPLEDEEDDASSIMATLDVSVPSKSWQASARPEQQLQAMVEISNSLGNMLSVEEILPQLLDSLFKIFIQADRGFVIMQPTLNGPLVPVATKARRGDDDQEMRVSKTIVSKAMSEKTAILSADAATDSRFNMAQSITDFQIRSLICAPMIDSDGKSVGVIQVDTRDQRSRFTDLDLQVLAGVANQAAIAIDNARMHEDAIKQRALTRDLELAREMQKALLPSEPPYVPGYHFFQYYQSAYQVGGDYYDYVTLPEERFAAVVGDVAGKGVSAAILMAKLSSDVRFWLAREPDTAKALGRINKAFSQHGWDDRFVTMIVAVVDPKQNELTLVNAGHMPPLLRNAEGQVAEVGGDQAGLPLGVIEDYEFEAFRRPLAPGEFLTMFTDGFSEAMNSQGDLFGIERLTELAGDRNVKSDALGPYILEQVRQFAGDFPQSDDMCLVCFGRE